jgi:hypothetical protein
MNAERKDQPSGVETQEQERPTDEHVVTSDLPTPGEPEAKTDATAAASEDKTEASPNAEDSATQTDKQENHKQRHAKRRWGKLNAKLGETQRENEANKARIAELESQVNQLKAATPKIPEPKLADFDTPREFAKAYAKWEQGATPKKPAAAPRETPAAPKSEPSTPPVRASDDEVERFTKLGKERLGDEFLEAMADNTGGPVPVNQLMGEFLFDSDVGPEIFVHLANNKDEAAKIYDASALRAEKALRALEAKAKKGELDVGDGSLQFEDDEEPEPEPQRKTAAKRTTKAPAPPSGTKESGSANLEPDPKSESMNDYAARRAKEEARKRGLVI